MMATIFAANALSVSVPIAGPELGAAFTFRRFKDQGADTSLAGFFGWNQCSLSRAAMDFYQRTAESGSPELTVRRIISRPSFLRAR
jgi:hypothetical protein